MTSGAQVICGQKHRSRCGLVMVADDEEQGVLRAGVDVFNSRSNFCDLPELPSIGKVEMNERSLLTSLDQLDRISKNMVFDEMRQVALFQ